MCKNGIVLDSMEKVCDYYEGRSRKEEVNNKNTPCYSTHLRFVHIEDVVSESDKNLSKPEDVKQLLVTWTNDIDEAYKIGKILNNTYVCLWYTPHKSLEDFKEWYIEKENLISVDGGLYKMPITPFVSPLPAGLKRGNSK